MSMLDKWIHKKTVDYPETQKGVGPFGEMPSPELMSTKATIVDQTANLPEPSVEAKDSLDSSLEQAPAAVTVTGEVATGNVVEIEQVTPEDPTVPQTPTNLPPAA